MQFCTATRTKRIYIYIYIYINTSTDHTASDGTYQAARCTWRNVSCEVLSKMLKLTVRLSVRKRKTPSSLHDLNCDACVASQASPRRCNARTNSETVDTLGCVRHAQLFDEITGSDRTLTFGPQASACINASRMFIGCVELELADGPNISVRPPLLASPTSSMAHGNFPSTLPYKTFALSPYTLPCTTNSVLFPFLSAPPRRPIRCLASPAV